MKKLLSLLLALSFLVTALISPTRAFADGMIMPSPHYPIYESGQTAAIFYQDGREHLVLSIEFYGNSLENFGWIVPTPSKPDVEKGDSTIFTELEEMTIPKETLLEKLMGDDNYYYNAVGADYGTAGGIDEKSTVEVIEEKRIGILDIATLRAGKVQDLLDWMEENNYNFPTNETVAPTYYYEETDEIGQVLPTESLEVKKVLQDYIDDEWYFVLSKVDPEFVNDDASTETIYDEPYYNDYYYKSNSKVDLTPLRISFDTPEIIYPMKISAGGLTSQSVLLYVFDDHKLQVSNYNYDVGYGYREDEGSNSRFTTSYAEKIAREDIEDLTSPVGKSSWLSPKDDMYLTKLFASSISYSDMDEDVLFEDAKDNKSVNAGEMTFGEWLLLPIVFVVYLPYNILTGFGGFLDYYYFDYGPLPVFIGIMFLVGICTVVSFFCALGLARLKKKVLRILLNLVLFPSVWVIGMALASMVSIPAGFIMGAAGIDSDVILTNVVLTEGLVSTALVMLGYKLLPKLMAKLQKKK